MTPFDSSLCRLCGERNEYAVYLFSSDYRGVELKDRINKFFFDKNTMILEDDNYPKSVCPNCEDAVNWLYQFRCKVHKVQQQFHDVYQEHLQLKAIAEGRCHSLHEASHISLDVSPDGSITCQLCNFLLSQELLLTMHSEHMPYNIDFYCKGCNFKGDGKVFIRDNVVCCPQCNKSTDKKFTCDQCHKAFRSRGHLNRHKLIHMNRKPFICDICGSEFNQKSSLNAHALVHTQLSFNCEWCLQQFKHKSSLESHLANFHGTFSANKKIYKCEYCKKSFINKSKFKRHYRSHSGEQPYSCHICGKKFNQDANLKTHIKKHKIPVPNLTDNISHAHVPTVDNLIQYPDRADNSSQAHMHTVDNLSLMFGYCHQLNNSEMLSTSEAHVNSLNENILNTSQVENLDENTLNTSTGERCDFVEDALNKASSMYFGITESDLYMDYANDIFDPSEPSKILSSFAENGICFSGMN